MRTAPAELLNWCQARQDWLRETIESLVAMESPSTDKPAVDRCGAELSRRLESIGAAVHRLPRAARGDHIRADFAGTGPRVLLLGHFDTVWPIGQLVRQPLREDDGRLHGPGIFDMKAGIAVSMLTAGPSRPKVYATRPDATLPALPVARCPSKPGECPVSREP